MTDNNYSFELDELNIYDLDELIISGCEKVSILESIKKFKDSERNRKYYKANRDKIIEKRKQTNILKKQRKIKSKSIKVVNQIYLDKKTKQTVINL